MRIKLNNLKIFSFWRNEEDYLCISNVKNIIFNWYVIDISVTSKIVVLISFIFIIIIITLSLPHSTEIELYKDRAFSVSLAVEPPLSIKRTFYVHTFYAVKRLDSDQLSAIRKNICPAWELNPRPVTLKQKSNNYAKIERVINKDPPTTLLV